MFLETKKKFSFFAQFCWIFFLLVLSSKFIFSDSSSLPGVESSDPERYFQRIKHIRSQRPKDPENTYRIANLYYSWKMEDEAIKEYRRCLKLDPNHLEAKWFLSHLLYNKGYFDEAFRLSREIMERKPQDPEIYYWAGEILLMLDQEEIAREYFSKADELKFPDREPPTKQKFPSTIDYFMRRSP